MVCVGLPCYGHIPLIKIYWFRVDELSALRQEQDQSSFLLNGDASCRILENQEKTKKNQQQNVTPSRN